MGSSIDHIKPNFLIVGAAKSGTTSLYYYLKDHPDIFMPKYKEPHFFIKDKIRFKIHKWVDSFDDYLRLFSDSENYKMRGEASVLYLYYWNEAIKNIINYLGKNIKIIIILRNPVDRAYSCYNFTSSVNPHENLPTFEEALEAEERRIEKNVCSPMLFYKSMGLYYEMVLAYKKEFKNLKILIFDDLVSNHKKVVEELYDFFGIPQFSPPSLQKKYNVGGNKWSNHLIGMTLKVLAINILRKKLQQSSPKFYTNLKNIVTKWLMDKTPEMRPETRDYLKMYYKNDVYKLSIVIEKDLSKWVS